MKAERRVKPDNIEAAAVFPSHEGVQAHHDDAHEAGEGEELEALESFVPQQSFVLYLPCYVV